jgi:hypothetical protein
MVCWECWGYVAHLDTKNRTCSHKGKGLRRLNLQMCVQWGRVQAPSLNFSHAVNGGRHVFHALGQPLNHWLHCLGRFSSLERAVQPLDALHHVARHLRPTSRRYLGGGGGARARRGRGSRREPACCVARRAKAGAARRAQRGRRAGRGGVNPPGGHARVCAAPPLPPPPAARRAPAASRGGPSPGPGRPGPSAAS